MPLGKSLGNILGDYFGEEVSLQNKQGDLPDGWKISNVKLKDIKIGQYQTRKNFDQEKINLLADNIKKNGLIHPIIVLEQEDGFVLLAGERRLRAVESLGWQEILAIIRPKDSLDQGKQALLGAMENLQREDLSALELAKTYQILLQSQKIEEEELAKLLGVSGQYIKNYLRLLTVSPAVQQALLEKKVTEGQIRQLVPLNHHTQDDLLKIIIQKELTIKEIKKLLSKIKQESEEKPSIVKKSHNLPTEIISQADKLAKKFPNSKLLCSGNEQKGKIVISWTATH